MKSTVVGSFPVEVKEATSTKNKLLSALGAYDSFKQSIEDSVIAQLDAGWSSERRHGFYFYKIYSWNED